MGVFIGLLFLAVMAGLIWWAIWQGQSGSMSFQSGQAPREVVVNAMHYFSTAGWMTTTQTTDSPTMTFTRLQAPGCGITLVLLLFGIIPGLLYWIAAKRTLTLSVSAAGSGMNNNESTVRVSWSRNGGGRGPSLEFKRLVAPNAPVLSARSYTPNPLASAVEEMSGGALSAVEMRREQRQTTPSVISAPAFCSICGTARTSSSAAFCASCGASFSASAPSSEQ